MGPRIVTDWLNTVGVELPDRSSTRPVRLRFDVPLALFTVALVVFGLLMVYSASWDFGYQNRKDPLYYFERQVFWAMLGAVILVAATFFKFQIWTRLALPVMGISVLALVLVLFIGDERHGAIRGLSAGSYQPSELAKLAMVSVSLVV